MNENRVVSLRQKDEIDDPLTEILRTGARRLITRAVEVEFDTFLASNSDLTLPDGRQRVVRHGHDPVRTIQTAIGPVKSAKAKGSRSWRAGGWRARSLRVFDPTKMGAANEDPGAAPPAQCVAKKSAKAPKRLAFSNFDRLVFAGLYRIAPRIVNALVIMELVTVIRWHPAGFHLFWRWKSRSRGGRPKVALEIRFRCKNSQWVQSKVPEYELAQAARTA